MKCIKPVLTTLCLLASITACSGTTGHQPTKGGSMGIIHLTKAEFLKNVYDYEASPNDWAYEGDKPCIVDFYATWCGPCKALAPVLEELAKEYEGRIYIYKVDVDKEKELAGAFGIRSIPTLLWIPMSGKPIVTQGAMPKAELKKKIEDTLLKGN